MFHTSKFTLIIKSTDGDIQLIQWKQKFTEFHCYVFISPVYISELPQDCLFSQTLTLFPHPVMLGSWRCNS